VWVPLPDKSSVVARLLRSGWAVAPGARYRLRSPAAIRVTCATLDESEAPRFAADLAEALQPQRRVRLV
jgi:hypothetical protein